MLSSALLVRKALVRPILLSKRPRMGKVMHLVTLPARDVDIRCPQGDTKGIGLE